MCSSDLAVHPDFRGKKVGQLLIDQIAVIAQKQGLKRITLEVNVSNSPAIHLYEKNGFKCTSIKENYYHNGTSAYYMQRPTYS